MRSFSKDILPDSFSGAIFAVEGIKDALVVLNGPTGCKFYHSAISDYQFPRELSFDPLAYPEIFYFGQPRVPTTFLDGYDYVYGSQEKLQKLLKILGKRNYALIAVVNSPGAALIGDDLDRFLRNEVADIPCLAIENTGFSGGFADGFQNALIKVMSRLDIKPPHKIPRTVNLLGISIYHKHYAGNINEIKKLLRLCGIDVVVTFCAGDTLNDMRRFADAQYNVILYPEYGIALADWLYKQYAMPYLLPEGGPPIGFRATAAFVQSVAAKLAVDPTPALNHLEKARARSFLHLSRFNSITGLPKGSVFAVRAFPSLAYAITIWLFSYLGMIPAAIELDEDDGGVFSTKLRDFLNSRDFMEVLDKPISSTDADVVFADGNTLAQLRLLEREFTGIEISLPSLGYLDITEKALFGATGALMFIEQIVNGLRFLYV